MIFAPPASPSWWSLPPAALKAAPRLAPWGSFPGKWWKSYPLLTGFYWILVEKIEMSPLMKIHLEGTNRGIFFSWSKFYQQTQGRIISSAKIGSLAEKNTRMWVCLICQLMIVYGHTNGTVVDQPMDGSGIPTSETVPTRNFGSTCWSSPARHAEFTCENKDSSRKGGSSCNDSGLIR